MLTLSHSTTTGLECKCIHNCSEESREGNESRAETPQSRAIFSQHTNLHSQAKISQREENVGQRSRCDSSIFLVHTASSCLCQTQGLDKSLTVRILCLRLRPHDTTVEQLWGNFQTRCNGENIYQGNPRRARINPVFELKLAFWGEHKPCFCRYSLKMPHAGNH